MKMRKWRVRKYDPSSSSATSIVGGIFPASWVSKFRKKGGNLEDSSKEKQRGKVDFPIPNATGWREGRFYSMDEDDAYWRLSFTDGRMNPPWHDSGDDAHVSVPSFKSLSLREMEVPGEDGNWNFNDMVLDVKKMKEKELEKGNLREGDELRRRRKEKGVKDHWFRQQPRKCELERMQDEENEVKSLKSLGKDSFEMEQDDTVGMEQEFKEFIVSNSRKQYNVSFESLDLSSIEEDRAYHCLNVDESESDETSENVRISEGQNLDGKKMKKGSRWKSSRDGNIRKANQRDGFKAYKTRATDDLTKSRTLKKKVRKDHRIESSTMFDCYAVVKSSFNPQRDFRDSMIEMMIEQDVRRSEELGELLACYLTFNRDEYHEIIIQVFRQACFELNGEVPYS